MNKSGRWLSGAILTILTIGVLILGLFYYRQNTQLKDTQSQLASLKNSVSAIQTSLSVRPQITDYPSPATEVVAAITPSMVRVDGAGPGFTKSGSGTIVDKRGYVLTNQHVIADDTSFKITVGGTVYGGQVVASDAALDLALLKIQSPKTDFPAVVFGTVSDIVPGATILALGFPLGANFAGPVTVTAGIIAALRDLGGIAYVQNDAAINPGNSGGCLVTLTGKMIGVPSAGYDPGSDTDLINLAIPVEIFSAYVQKNLPA